MNNINKYLLLILILLFNLSFTACGAEPDPNAGVYEAYSAEMYGLKIGVEEAYPDGFTIELKDGGKCKLTIGDQYASGKWTLDGTMLNVSGGGVELNGTLENSLMTFPNAIDSGMTLTFLLKGAQGPEFTSATEIVDGLQQASEAVKNAK